MNWISACMPAKVLLSENHLKPTQLTGPPAEEHTLHSIQICFFSDWDYIDLFVSIFLKNLILVMTEPSNQVQTDGY